MKMVNEFYVFLREFVFYLKEALLLLRNVLLNSFSSNLRLLRLTMVEQFR